MAGGTTGALYLSNPGEAVTIIVVEHSVGMFVIVAIVIQLFFNPFQHRCLPNPKNRTTFTLILVSFLEMYNNISADQYLALFRLNCEYCLITGAG